MNILEYENYHETKSHVDPLFPYNTYPCTIPLDFKQVPTHWHDEIEFIVIKKGHGRIHIDLEPHIVAAGTIIILAPGQLHSLDQIQDETMEYENIIFDLSMLMSKQTDICTSDYFAPFLQRQRIVPSVINASFDYYHELLNCITQIDFVCSSRPNSYQLAIKSYIYQFFYILFTHNQSTDQPHKSKKNLDKLKQILKYVESNYPENISIQDMAELTSFSKSHFMKFFKNYMETSFTEYLNDYRLTMAARLFISSSNTILEVATETGFENLSYFNRLFKKKYNATPSSYRKMHQNN